MLTGKNILVTGASRGLGLIITESLLSKGATVFAISRSKSQKLDELSLKCGKRLQWLQYDLVKIEDIKENVFKHFIGGSFPIHGYINNAAMAYDDLITNLDTKKVIDMYYLNVLSPMVITKYSIRHMLLHNIKGSIVHISSISVHTGYKGLAMYASSKGAIEAFSKSTAREWGEKGIRSNCIVSGFMETEMSSSLSVEQKNKIYNRTSLKLQTSPQCVANTAAFLLTNESNSITGQNIFVDSGTI